ncbi:polysaccharide pyruvyl transferase family protein [Methylophaga sp.]|uniref:polysaccharide pyruvyl transferase family protein n=1 Tax=Methylophaga sp. TaxID=2024840 RepID=UPI003A91D970
MNIVIDNSGYGLDNIGDVAMLQVAVERLNKIWPEANIHVISQDSAKLTSLIPNAEFFSSTTKRAWQSDYNLIGGLKHLFPKKMQNSLKNFEAYIRINFPEISLMVLAWRFGKTSPNFLNAKKMLELISKSDLVIATGGGYVNDTFSSHASKLLDVLLLAQYFQKPTAMLGQGLGPLSNKDLSKKFKRVLSHLQLISLREGAFSPKILECLSALSEKPTVIVSGDDAIEKSYTSRTHKIGNKVGLNIRNASYANLPEGTIEKLSLQIELYIRNKNTSYQLLPISLVSNEESDIYALASLLKLDTQQLYKSEMSLSVNTIIERVSECRVVVTGSYHAALFALSQGIQVIGLTASKYYDSKFMGLLKQFESGVQILHLNDEVDKLQEYLDFAWNNAETERDKLLNRAAEQIGNGRKAYIQLESLVT